MLVSCTPVLRDSRYMALISWYHMNRRSQQLYLEAICQSDASKSQVIDAGVHADLSQSWRLSVQSGAVNCV